MESVTRAKVSEAESLFVFEFVHDIRDSKPYWAVAGFVGVPSNEAAAVSIRDSLGPDRTLTRISGSLWAETFRGEDPPNIDGEEVYEVVRPVGLSLSKVESS